MTVYPDAPAFPATEDHYFSGMTLRTYAAIEAMKGMLANAELGKNLCDDDLAKQAIYQADTLMHYLEEEGR